MTAVTASTAGKGRFLYDDSTDILYYDTTGESAIGTDGAFTAGADHVFAVLKGVDGLKATDFSFA